MSKRKLIKILYRFDKKSKHINFSDFYNYRNLISFENICEYKYEYFKENYEYSNKKCEKYIIDNIIDFIHIKDDLISNNILSKNPNNLINSKECKKYLNIFNSTERFFRNYERTLTFIIGLITGGGIVEIITKLFNIL